MNPLVAFALALLLLGVVIGIWWLTSRLRNGFWRHEHRPRPSGSGSTDADAERRRESQRRLMTGRDELEQRVDREVARIDKDVAALNRNYKQLSGRLDEIEGLLAKAPRTEDGSSSSSLRGAAAKETGYEFGFSSGRGARTGAAMPAVVTPESRAAEAERAVLAYCGDHSTMKDLIVIARRVRLVWGSIDINKMPPRFERELESDLMAIGAVESGDTFVIVGEACAYNEMKLSVFFNRLVAGADQRVFATTPAIAVLKADGTIEARRPGVLELR